MMYELFQTMLLLFVAFQFKHFICDFPLQACSYMYKNKGTYMHPGGIIHTSIHMLGSAIICYYFQLPYWIVGLDGIIHYHIDYCKMKINAHYNLTPTYNESFWILLGLDQLLHQLTYILLIYLVL